MLDEWFKDDSIIHFKSSAHFSDNEVTRLIILKRPRNLTFLPQILKMILEKGTNVGTE
jgi:hypothetical protein